MMQIDNIRGVVELVEIIAELVKKGLTFVARENKDGTYSITLTGGY